MFKGKLSYAILFSVALFAAFFFAGVFAVRQDSSGIEALLQTLTDGIFGYIADQSPPMMALTLFINNLEVSLILFLGGATFGILTTIILLTNGALIGAVVEYTASVQGPAFIAAGLIPHGIFEISGFIISAGLGFMLAESMWLEYRGKGDAADYARRAGKTFACVVTPLLAVAAIVEAFITPQIIDLVLQGV